MTKGVGGLPLPSDVYDVKVGLAFTTTIRTEGDVRDTTTSVSERGRPARTVLSNVVLAILRLPTDGNGGRTELHVGKAGNAV